MIIYDLDHLEPISRQNQTTLHILGQGIMISPPTIDLQAFVITSAFPPSLDMFLIGNVKAGSVALMKVFSGGYVRAISPL